MDKKQRFFIAVSIYIDPNGCDFFWTCNRALWQGTLFRIKCNKVSWRGEVRIPAKKGFKWKKMKGSYYVKKDSIAKAIAFYKQYK
jgi:hypothetical protein